MPSSILDTLSKTLKSSSNNIVTSKFKGGMITRVDRQSVPNGAFSNLTNFRWIKNGGFETRLGQKKLHTIDSSGGSIKTIYQLEKKDGEMSLFRQCSNGSVEKSTLSSFSEVTTGEFGTQVLAGNANSSPASWATLDDKLFYSDHTRGIYTYSGTSFVYSFIVVKGSATIPRIAIEGNDYTIEVTDNDVSNGYAVLNSLNTASNYNYIYILCPLKATSLSFLLDGTNVNANSSTASVEYWKGSWASVSNLIDNTSVSGKTFAQTGTMSWDDTSDELPSYNFSQTGYWYRISVSNILSANVYVYKAQYTSKWQKMNNIFDGSMIALIEAQYYLSASNNYYYYGTSSVDIAKMTTSDKLYFSSITPLEAIYIDVGATPNITQATITGNNNISFYDGISGDDYVTHSGNGFLDAGFEQGQSVTISGTTNHNGTFTIKTVTSNTMYFPTGSFSGSDETNKSATITFNNGGCSISSFQVYTGNGWTTATVEDTTNGLTKSGYISWDRTSVNPSKSQFNSSGYYAYWYSIKWTKQLSGKVSISIQGIPYFDIDELGNSVANASWKGRLAVAYDKYPYVYISSENDPSFINGSNFGLIEVGDGRSNKILCMKPFYNDLMVWQEEKGVEGGCTTIIEGYQPSGTGAFGKLVLSNKIGILNSKCAVVIEAVKTSTATDENIETVAFWLSRQGLVATNGKTFFIISDDIQNYFDSSKAECIREGYEDKHYLSYDSKYNILRIGLVSGPTATDVNIFLVYDLNTKVWGYDVFAQNLSCMVEISNNDNTQPIVQIAGGSEGYIYQVNTGTTDNNENITSTAILELDNDGKWLRLAGELLRVKAQSYGNITRTLDLNCINTFTKNTAVLLLEPQQYGEQYRRHRFKENILGNHVSIKWTSKDNLTLYDFGVEMYEWEGQSR